MGDVTLNRCGDRNRNTIVAATSWRRAVTDGLF
jgi:hypothetical protein